MKLSGRRRKDGAEQGRAVNDEADVHRIILAAADELLGAVERVDEEESVSVRGDAAGGDFLLGNDRDAGSCSRQCGEDDQLGGAVGLRDRRAVGLVLDVEPVGDDLKDRRARFLGGGSDILQQLPVIAQRGAILMPPSSRMSSALR